jgi:hypothetical protein
MRKHITTRIDSSLPELLTSSQSPSHVDLCHFKVTVLAPLQWGHKHFQVLGILPIPKPAICALSLAYDPSPTALLHLP